MKRLLNRIADWLIERAKRTPYWYIDQNGGRHYHLYGKHGDPYMARYWLVPYNRFGIAARVHHILRGDEDRHLHDHPWWSISIILRGGYWEMMPEPPGYLPHRVTTVWRGPGSIVFRRARDWHRLVLDANYVHNTRQECWTLFITGPQRKDGDPNHSCWGFLVDGEKVPSDVYLGERYVATNYEGERA